MGSRDSKTHIVFGMITHGNETKSLPGYQPFIDHLENDKEFQGTVTIFLGKCGAALNNARYLEPTSTESHSSNQSHRQNVAGLPSEPNFASATLLVDFHQTILACMNPFISFLFIVLAINGQDIWQVPRVS